jgi:hypothetical protein
VTRLGDFSLFENYKSSPKSFGLIFFLSKGYALIWTKMGSAKFSVIFSQTHLVTLLVRILPKRCLQCTQEKTPRRRLILSSDGVAKWSLHLLRIRWSEFESRP